MPNDRDILGEHKRAHCLQALTLFSYGMDGYGLMKRWGDLLQLFSSCFCSCLFLCLVGTSFPRDWIRGGESCQSLVHTWNLSLLSSCSSVPFSLLFLPSSFFLPPHHHPSHSWCVSSLIRPHLTSFA